MKIKYDRKKCIGCGICATDAPHIWQLSTIDGKADILDAEFKRDHYFRVLWPDEAEILPKIITICPARAIQVM